MIFLGEFKHNIMSMIAPSLAAISVGDEGALLLDSHARDQGMVVYLYTMLAVPFM